MAEYFFENTDKPSFGNTLKILMLTWEYPPNVVGGLSRHVHGLSVQLASIGVEVHVVTAGNGDLPEYEFVDHVHIHRVSPLNATDEHFLNWIAGLNVAIAIKASQLSEKINFKLVHVHDWLAGAAAIALKDVLQLPLLTTIHATEYGRNDGIHNEIQRAIHKQEKHLIESSDHLIVCSDYMREELTAIFGVSSEKLSIIANGIDALEAKGGQTIHLPDRNGKKLIFSVGRIVAEKGFETIIEAAELAKQTATPVFFVIAGKGPMLANYQKIVVDRDLADAVDFIGYITDEEKEAYYRECSVAVFPSLYEPFGIVALESMKHGKPTIVTRVGGLQGIIQHMETGFLIPPDDPAQLLNQINFLLKNPQEADLIGLQGSKMVKSLYGWKRIATETKRAMEDLLLQNQIRTIENEQMKGKF